MEKNFDALFMNPTKENRGYPFWAWNCKLDKEEVLAQVDYFREMGLGGFTIHARTGLDTEYLGEEFMEIVAAVVAKAKQYGMKAQLYDEDRWPSGFGGGAVTQEARFRKRKLVFSPEPYDPAKEHTTFLARYAIVLENGYLKQYQRLTGSDVPSADETIWVAYLEISGDIPWFNSQSYVNTLDPKAMERFLETTHEKYYALLGQEFGTTIPSIFTDEPEFQSKQFLRFADAKEEIALPYTDDFDDTFFATYGVRFLDHLPTVVWELPNHEVSVLRYQYHDHLAERFAGSFSDTIGNWCDAHNIKLTGHLMSESELGSQSDVVGEVMRGLRGFAEPGIDMLCNRREFSTAKQAQSVAHQYDREGVLSELYGVTNWDFDFRGHKLQGDWQAALGVTTRVHHLSYMTMEGESKRDYPASIFYQSPWYQQYKYIENHFSRLNLALLSGKPIVKVGVIHPIESYWIASGPWSQTKPLRNQLEEQFNQIIHWHLFGLIDFDFISEASLPSLSNDEAGSTFQVGAMQYDIVVVPGCLTLRRTTLERLQAFTARGGKVVFAGALPTLVDAKKSDEVKQLADKYTVIAFSQAALMDTLATVRFVEILDSGARTDDLIYQLRADGSESWLFIAKAAGPDIVDTPNAKEIQIILSGVYTPTLYDTLTGERAACPYFIANKQTIIQRTMYEHDSILLHLAPQSQVASDAAALAVRPTATPILDWKEPVAITLSEPNVLILDQAAWRLTDGPWYPADEVLRIDNLVCEKLGYPLKKLKSLPQPWTIHEENAPGHMVELKYQIFSEIAVVGTQLAIEQPHLAQITLNGLSVDTTPVGWFTDKSIKLLDLPLVPAGESTLLVRLPYFKKTNLEWMYLLGDFGVKIQGSNTTLIAPTRKLGFGDWVPQGLPFYAGNVTYHLDVDLAPGDYVLDVPKYRAPVLEIFLDDQKLCNLAFSPYRVDLGTLEGRHRIAITAYGSRINAFGALHNCDENTVWFGPGAWRTDGNSYSYEYNLKRCGILTSPKILRLGP